MAGQGSGRPPDERSPQAAAALLEQTVWAERRSVVATLARRFGDLDVAEDAFQDAVGDALLQWPMGEPPANPAAWLLTVAHRRAIDRLRRESQRPDREERSVAQLARFEPPEPSPHGDDQLALVLTCCHPALAIEAQVALTLKAVAGLSTAEIGRAFLVAEPTMAQRIVRAKRKIATAGIPFVVPEGADLDDRIEAACAVVYLIFNEGHRATGGEHLVRHDLCEEAIRLGRLLHDLMPDDDEVVGLLALMLLTDARRPTRLDAAGEVVLLEEQDRTRWDEIRRGDGLALLHGRPIGPEIGLFRLQAEVAHLHAEAPSFAETDWRRIVVLYALMEEATDSPVVRLNRAVAVAMADGPLAGLTQVDDLAADGALEGYAHLHAARADLLRRLDRRTEAAEAYQRALALTDNGPEQRYLARRLAEVTVPPPPANGSPLQDPRGL